MEHDSISEYVEEHLKRISTGAVELIPQDEMRSKLQESIRRKKPLVVKLGVDPTRPDLHLGHSVPLNKLRDFQALGHQVVLIIGDFTATIGDPSQQDQTRPVLTNEEIEKNARTYVEQAQKIINTARARLVRNSQWLAPLKFEDVLRLTSNFTVARILERDDFERRFKENRPLRLHEVLYPVMQAYDSVMLDADVEIGGTDQKFNLLAGRTLQRAMGQSPQVVLTLPLLEGTDGVHKMSKSLGNDIGLTDGAREMFGKVMSIPDDVMWNYFTLVTQVSEGEVERMRGDVESGERNPRDIKERLAREIVELYHGQEASKKSEEEFRRVFSEGGLPLDIPAQFIQMSKFPSGRIWVVSLLVSLGLASSKSEARRLITGGGLTIGGERVEDPEVELEPESIDGKVIRKGRKTFVRVEIIP